jgi:nitroreductase
MEKDISEVVNAWATRQVYIALGNLMTAAAMLGIDVCPMEGIIPEKYDEILNLKEKGYKTVVVGAVGYRSATDKYATTPKVRYKNEDMVTIL